MKVAKMSADDLATLKRKARKDRGSILGHLICCYETMFENACDPNSDVLEFKPEILEAVEFKKSHICEKENL